MTVDDYGDDLLRRLVEALEKNPELRAKIAELLSKETYVTRDEMTRVLDEIRLLREDNDRRFEEVFRRFEAIDRRFEAVDRRFDRLEMAFQDVRRDVATISTRYGLRLEDIFREIFREALLTEGVDPEKLRRLVVVDKDGVVCPAGEMTDIDMMVTDSQCVFVEVKARADLHDVWAFLKKVELAEAQEGVKATRLILVTLHISPVDRQKAEEMGVRVITSETWEDK